MNDASAQVQENLSITATLVAESERYKFLPTYYRSMFMAAEQLTFGYAERFISGYSGAYWNFFTLSNGSFFMSPSEAGQLRVVIGENYTDELMSAEAAGIVVTLYVLSYLMSIRIRPTEKNSYIELYRKLLDYVYEHKECAGIMRAID